MRKDRLPQVIRLLERIEAKRQLLKMYQTATDPSQLMLDETADLSPMDRAIMIAARWDAEAGVWIATSDDVPGLVVEAATWPSIARTERKL